MISGVVALLAAPVLGVVGIFVGYALNARREDRSIDATSRYSDTHLEATRREYGRNSGVTGTSAIES